MCQACRVVCACGAALRARASTSRTPCTPRSMPRTLPRARAHTKARETLTRLANDGNGSGCGYCDGCGDGNVEGKRGVTTGDVGGAGDKWQCREAPSHQRCGYCRHHLGGRQGSSRARLLQRPPASRGAPWKMCQLSDEPSLIARRAETANPGSHVCWGWWGGFQKELARDTLGTWGSGAATATQNDAERPTGRGCCGHVVCVVPFFGSAWELQQEREFGPCWGQR